MNKIKQLNKEIQKTNSKFQKMNKSEKRIAIAQDVLKALKAKRLIAHSGAYCGVNSEKRQDMSGKSLQKLILKDETMQCNVCAIGSLFTAFVTRDNEFLVKKKHVNEEGFNAYFDAKDVLKKLKSLFAIKQLRLMEMVFENRDYEGLFKASEKAKATRIYNKFDCSESRLKYIMRNVIKNEGEFVL